MPGCTTPWFVLGLFVIDECTFGECSVNLAFFTKLPGLLVNHLCKLTPRYFAPSVSSENFPLMV